MPPPSTAPPAPRPAAALRPRLLYANGVEQKTLELDPLPYTIGRRPTHALAIALPQISRDHARIETGDGGYHISDLGSTHGTLVNGERITRHRLQPGDRIEFPNCHSVHLVFEPDASGKANASMFLTQMRKLEASGGSDFDRLRLLLDFGQRLRSGGVLEEILGALVETALRLTGAERGFMFVRTEASDTARGGSGLSLAVGRAGNAIVTDDSTISHSVVEKAAASSSAFIISDTLQASGELGQSVMANDLRTVVAIPLREVRTYEKAGEKAGERAVLGVLYLDSHAASPQLQGVSRELLHMLAGEAAQLVNNAQLARREEDARAMEKELALAAAIQQGLMAGAMPETAFATVRGLSQPCRQIGGDFFDALMGSEGNISLVLADVSGKGAAAALLAASLQGLTHAQLSAGRAASEIADLANRFVWERLQGEKYATLLIVSLRPGGELEYLNCGHLPPLLILPDGKCETLDESNLPVGLIPGAAYEAAQRTLPRGTRLLLVTDGVTEAAAAEGDMFGDLRLQQMAQQGASLEEIAAAVRTFCAGAPLGDDLTLVEIQYK